MSCNSAAQGIRNGATFMHILLSSIHHLAALPETAQEDSADPIAFLSLDSSNTFNCLTRKQLTAVLLEGCGESCNLEYEPSEKPPFSWLIFCIFNRPEKNSNSLYKHLLFILWFELWISFWGDKIIILIPSWSHCLLCSNYSWTHKMWLFQEAIELWLQIQYLGFWQIGQARTNTGCFQVIGSLYMLLPACFISSLNFNWSSMLKFG